MSGWNTEQLQDAFSRHLPTLPGRAIAAARQAALDAFTGQALPTRRTEAWRYTDVSRLARWADVWPTEGGASSVELDLSAWTYPEVTCGCMVFVDGHFRADLSSHALPTGVSLSSLSGALDDDPSMAALWSRDYRVPASAFSTLNAAIAPSGAVLRVADGVQCDRPLQWLFVNTGTATEHVRNLVHVGAGARLDIIESHVGSDTAERYWRNIETRVQVDAGGHFSHFKIQNDRAKAWQFHRLAVELKAAAQAELHGVQLGGELVRNDVIVEFSGPEAHATLNSLALSNGRQHVDNHVYLQHLVPACTSDTRHKAAVNDRARSVFNGAIYVAPDAQKTDAQLNNANLLLSDEAEIDTKPELEIYADDVACSHGATVGQLDEDSLHYLRSRGIGKALAHDLLVFAFCSDIIERVSSAQVRERLLAQVLEKMPNRAALEGVLG